MPRWCCKIRKAPSLKGKPLPHRSRLWASHPSKQPICHIHVQWNKYYPYVGLSHFAMSIWFSSVSIEPFREHRVFWAQDMPVATWFLMCNICKASPSLGASKVCIHVRMNKHCKRCKCHSQTLLLPFAVKLCYWRMLCHALVHFKPYWLNHMHS